jgi:hypothetical protein
MASRMKWVAHRKKKLAFKKIFFANDFSLKIVTKKNKKNTLSE